MVKERFQAGLTRFCLSISLCIKCLDVSRSTPLCENLGESVIMVSFTRNC